MVDTVQETVSWGRRGGFARLTLYVAIMLLAASLLFASVVFSPFTAASGGGSQKSMTNAPKGTPSKATAGTTFPVDVYTEPTNCGSVEINGSYYTTGGTVYLSTGIYQISSESCQNTVFSTWKAGSSNLSVSSNISSTTTLTVTGSGSLYMTSYSSYSSYSVSFETGPTNCGSTITFAGSQHANSATTNVIPGTYTITANPCTGAGWKFTGWAGGPQGGITFGSQDSPSTTVTIGAADATITANFLTSASYPVTFVTGPTNCGTIWFSGVGYSTGQTVKVASGSSYGYNIEASPCAGFAFYNGDGVGWGTDGSSAINFGSGSGANPTIVTITGGGTISAMFISDEGLAMNFATGPTACGTIYLNGNAFTDDTSYPGSNLAPGVYNLTAAACGGFTFSSWNTGIVPGLVVANPHSTETTATLTASDTTLTANFTAAPLYSLAFFSGPEGCGAIDFNGVAYTSGQSTSVASGTYNIAPDPCTGFRAGDGVHTWGTTTGGTISIGSGTVTVTGNGELTVIYTSATTSILSLQTGPSSCGSIYFDGIPYTNGESLEDTPGNYTVTATPCAGYTFSQWTYSGGIVVLSPSSMQSTADFTSSATLGALFTTGTPVTTSFVTNPSSCGSIEFSGGAFSNGQSVNVASGVSYDIEAEPCYGYVFSTWSASAGLTVTSTASKSTSVTVNSAGSLTATFSPISTTYQVYFYTGPTTCGSLTVNGTTTYTNGQSAVLYPGVPYAITPNPCGNSFSYWTPQGGVTLGSGPSVSSNSFTVSRSGNLTVTFASATLYTVVFHTAPIGCGFVSFDNSNFTDGQSVQVSPGTYTIAEYPCNNTYSGGYASNGAITISGGVGYTTIAQIGSPSNLTALFLSYTLYNIDFLTSPTTCGTISFANESYTNGQTAYFSPGTYHVADFPCANFQFLTWNSSGGVPVSSPSQETSVVTVSSNGTLSAADLGTVTYPVTFETGPQDCGSIDVGEYAFTNGQTLSLSAGSYALSAVPCQNSSFNQWGTEGSVTVGSGTLTVSGQGVVTADFGTQMVDTVTVFNGPTSCGTVYVGGLQISDGGSNGFTPGNYSISATSCANFAFQSWTGSQFVGVLRPGALNTTVWIHGSGSLYVTFAGTPSATVTFETEPTTCGAIDLGGVDYTSGQTITLTGGGSTYTAFSDPCALFGFNSWSSQGGVMSSGGAQTTITVSGDGTLIASYSSQVKDSLTLFTGPVSCGTISVDNTGYTDGAVVDLSPGNYTFNATACSGFTFASWGASPPSSLSISSPSSATTTVDIIENYASLTATFLGKTSYNINVETDPTDCGTVAVSGNTLAQGESVRLSSGTYEIAANPCSGSSFMNWVAFGNVTISGSSSNTTAAVSGNGTILAYYYRPLPSVNVYLVTGPTNCGTISFGSGNYSSGQNDYVAPGIYNIIAWACSGFKFVGWSTYGDINVSSPSSAVTTVNVTSGGYIYATFASSSTFKVEVLTNPANCGVVSIDGANYSNGHAPDLSSGIYYISAYACLGGQFLQWITTGSVSVTSGFPQTINVQGTGSVEANFSVSKTFTVNLDTDPANCGSITFSGQSYVNGQDTLVPNGNYPITASACAGDTFSAWQASGGISIASGGSETSTAMVFGNGTLTAAFATTGSLFSISISTNPQSCGYVQISGANYIDGTDANLPSGSYKISGYACAGEMFQSWSVSGDVSVVSTSTNDTTLTVSGTGSLSLSFTQAVTYPVNIVTNPDNCGSVTIDGATTSGGQNAILEAGSYSLSANPCSGATFGSWGTSGGISVGSRTTSPTTIDVSSAGTLWVNFTTSGQMFNIDFDTTPLACGSITFNNVSYTGGESASIHPGTYPISANACSGASFANWYSSTQEIVFRATTNQSTAVTISGSGTLTANFTGVKTYQLLIGTSPSSCGGVTVAGQHFTNDQSAIVTAGNYHASSTSCSGYSFQSWSATGGVTLLSSSTSQSVQISVVGNGNLLVTFETNSGSKNTTTTNTNSSSLFKTIGTDFASFIYLGIIILVIVIIERVWRRGGKSGIMGETAAGSGAVATQEPLPPPPPPGGPGPAPVAPSGAPMTAEAAPVAAATAEAPSATAAAGTAPFCESCGAQLASPGDRFCMKCGAKVGDEAGE